MISCMISLSIMYDIVYDIIGLLYHTFLILCIVLVWYHRSFFHIICIWYHHMELLDWPATEKDCKMKRGNEFAITTRIFRFRRYSAHGRGPFREDRNYIFFYMILTCIRQHAFSFLQRLCCCSLLGIWRSIQDARSCDEKLRYAHFKQ